MVLSGKTEQFSLTEKSIFITGCVQSFLFSLVFLKYLHQCPETESSTGCCEINCRVISLLIYKLMPFLIPLGALLFYEGHLISPSHHSLFYIPQFHHLLPFSFLNEIVLVLIFLFRNTPTCL